MKASRSLRGIVTLQLVLAGAAIANTSTNGVTPTLFDSWRSGDAASEARQAGGGTACGSFATKIDNWASGGMDGIYTHAGNTIAISKSDAKTFTWSSEKEICAVIVKGGNSANVYNYGPGACTDSGLCAPVNNSGNNADISHVTFVWNDINCNGYGKCYQEETAWSAGRRYVTRGNWATYTPYVSGGTVNIYAGQTYLAGTATFSAVAVGQVTITINLNPGFIFYYDVTDQVADNNIKIQDYVSPPSGNPAPGLFTHKASAQVGSTSYVITVPANNFYGIHLDVAREVPCP